jgi:hypothetical protein
MYLEAFAARDRIRFDAQDIVAGSARTYLQNQNEIPNQRRCLTQRSRCAHFGPNRGSFDPYSEAEAPTSSKINFEIGSTVNPPSGQDQRQDCGERIYCGSAESLLT